VSHDALKLTVYFGENDRAGHALLSDALLDTFARHELRSSVLLRGAEGFGIKQRLRSERLLTLSEDLPLVAVAVDAPERIEALLPEAVAMLGDGLVTLERASTQAATDSLEAKLTVYCGRQERIDGRPAFVAIVDLLRRRGLSGATVLLGVDGTSRGERRRARFFGRNADVPLTITSVGAAASIAALVEELEALLDRPLLTVERVRVCRRDGQALAAPADVPDGRWQKLTVYSSEHHGLHVELIQRLRAAGAAGATSLRGLWGYHGDHEPHGDRLLSLRRHVPITTVIVDEPAAARRWFEIATEVTSGSGLVTSELVPAARATAAEVRRGALELAE
jgi:PII-like signaling protein